VSWSFIDPTRTMSVPYLTYKSGPVPPLSVAKKTPLCTWLSGATTEIPKVSMSGRACGCECAVPQRCGHMEELNESSTLNSHPNRQHRATSSHSMAACSPDLQLLFHMVSFLSKLSVPYSDVPDLSQLILYGAFCPNNKDMPVTLT
jgi:hypothetical protein